jgi:ribonuclease HI
MDPETVIAQLQWYERRHADLKGRFAGVTWRLLFSEMGAGRNVSELLTGPLISDVVLEAAMEVACGWTPESAERARARASASLELPAPPTEAGVKLAVYCDGCCLNNGRPGAMAGFGVAVYDADRNVTHRAAKRIGMSEPQTNQRAELRALLYTLTYISDKDVESVDIYTDSRYGIDCLTKWYKGWESAGWRKSDGKPVLHVDIIRPCVEYLKAFGSAVRLHHVEAHTGRSDAHSLGNALADTLAREGAGLV